MPGPESERITREYLAKQYGASVDDEELDLAQKIAEKREEISSLFTKEEPSTVEDPSNFEEPLIDYIVTATFRVRAPDPFSAAQIAVSGQVVPIEFSSTALSELKSRVEI